MELTTFWLGTILLGTVRRGGFLTTALWVPKEVWIQPTAAVPCYFEKVALLKFCSEMFTKISKINVHNIKALLSVRLYLSLCLYVAIGLSFFHFPHLTDEGLGVDWLGRVGCVGRVG